MIEQINGEETNIHYRTISINIYRNNERNKKSPLGPDKYGLVVWALCHRARDCWFKSWSGHMAGFWARSPVGGMQEATNQCFSLIYMFLSFSFSLPSPLSEDKWIKYLK